MNTPAHIMINMLCLGRQDTANILTPVVVGAFLPDAPMFIFYFVEKVIKGTPEGIIWREAYYKENWQNFIDIFNSIPLIIFGLVFTGWLGSKIGIIFFSSMFLHIVGDFPLHHNDAHRHFFPFSNWRFQSPVSYWDPNHYGTIVTILEILAVIISCVVLFQTYQSMTGRISVGLIGVSYLAYFIYVFTVWV
ncbi:hypothetical protein [Coleofasciculus sp. G2-EDA-02]|uniref:hypothetical protein n=1 Tax=Coleofasciculus sp. G2-EDA-02 TaxID=3069529 RepID=UPI003303F69F